MEYEINKSNKSNCLLSTILGIQSKCFKFENIELVLTVTQNRDTLRLYFMNLFYILSRDANILSKIPEWGKRQIRIQTYLQISQTSTVLC